MHKMGKAICPNCGNEEVVKNGFYKYSDKREQRFLCKKCGRVFQKDSTSPFLMMRHSKQVILFGVRLYTEFYLSAYECSILIKDVMNIRVSGRSILYWVQKLAPSFQKISRLYKPSYSKIWHMDEMFVNRKGSKNRPGRQGYLITVLDENRQVLASFLSPRRTSKAALKTFRMAVEKTGFYPDIVSTDKCKIYDSLRRYRKTRHVHTHFETKIVPRGKGVMSVSQNRIERYHAEIRPKENQMRGINNFTCGTRLFQLRGVIHNYLRRHMTLGVTPAENAGVNQRVSWEKMPRILEECGKMKVS
ncbi:MAG: DDE-type integrase/transposase/recombinase [Candidatus Thermoplasmatota archaeon]